MESDDLPSTSKRAKHSKKASDKCNASTRYPVAFEEFRKFTNVDEYVVREMERSGPDIHRINFAIRHKYYPVVYKKFYESRAVREKMLCRGLSVKPIPRFLKERLMRMPGEDQPLSLLKSTFRTKDKQCKVDAKIKPVQTKHSRSFTAISPAFKVLTEKNKKTIKKSADKDASLRLTPKTTVKAKFKPPLRKDVNDIGEDEQKITNFFSTLKLVKVSETISNSSKEEGNMRKRKPEPRDMKDVDASNVSQNIKKPKNTGRPFESKSMPSSPYSRRKIETDRVQERRKNLNKFKNDENQRKIGKKSRFESSISDDSDIHSNGEIMNSTDTRNNSPRKTSFISSPSTLQKSPLPKRNRVENFQKPSSNPKKPARKKDTHKSDSDQKHSFSDVETALLSVSGAHTKTSVQVSSEIHSWLNKAIKTLEEESDDESVLSFFEEEFTAIDKLKAIEKYPNDVKNYIKYLLNAEIQKRNMTNVKPVKHRGVSRSKVVAAFAEMTFDDYKILINAEKIYSQGLSEMKTFEEITSGLREQYDAIIEGKRAWPRYQHVKLSTIRTYLRSKGLHGYIELKYIPPRLLSFEECLEHTNIKECISFSRPKPPGSYKQLMNMCKKTYIKCCTEGVWTDGLHFTDSNNQQEEVMQYTQFKGNSPVLPSIQEITDQSTHTSVESLSKSQHSSDEQQDSVHVNLSKNSDNPADDAEKVSEKMPAESQLKAAKSNEALEQQLNTSLHTPACDKLPVSQSALGLIPPSPSLFQSSGESDQKICESQQVNAPPPEMVFIPCNRSMILNTEENNITANSADHRGDRQDPFAVKMDSENQERRLDDSPVQKTLQDFTVLESVVKKEPRTASGNNTQAIYSPLDDSVEIIEIPPSEPIVIEDEESAPDLLNMLITGPAQDNLNLRRCVQNNGSTSTANAPPTQSLTCEETFVHAQQLPSNLSLMQSQLNPPHLHGEITREHSTTEKEKNIDSLSNVNTEREINMETDKQCEIALIKNILNKDTQQSVAIYEQSLSRRRSLQSPINLNESQPQDDADSSKAIDADQTNRNDGTNNNDVPPIEPKCHGSLVESSYVSIPPQKIPSEVESSHITEVAICINESTAHEKQQHFNQVTDSLIVDYQEDPTLSEETESANKKNEDNLDEQCREEFIGPMNEIPNSVSVYVFSTQNADLSENLIDPQVETSVRLNEPLIIEIKRLNNKNFDPSMSSEDNPVRHTDNQRSNTDIDASEKDAGEEHQSSNEERQEDIPSEVSQNKTHVHIRRRLSRDMYQPLLDQPIAEKINITNKDLNDNVAKDALHFAEFPYTKAQQNEPIDVCNLEGNKNSSETEISLIESDIQLMQISDEDDLSVDKEIEADALKIVEETSFSDNGGSIKKFLSNYEVQHGIYLKRDNIDEIDTQSSTSGVSRQVQEQSSASSSYGIEEDANHVDVNNLANGSSYEVLENLEQRVKQMPYEQTYDLIERNQCTKENLNPVELDSNLLGFETKNVIQPIVADAIQQNSSTILLDSQAEESPNLGLSHNISVNPINYRIQTIQTVELIENITEASSFVITSETLNLNKKRTYVLPAILPIAALTNYNGDDFIENPEMEDESEIDDDKENLVEIPIFINRRYIKFLPFSIVTPQQVQQSSKESAIYAVKTKLEFCSHEFGMPDINKKENEATAIPQQLESSTNQKKTAESDPCDNTEAMSKTKPKKRCQGEIQKNNKRLRLGKLKSDSCTSVENQLSNESNKVQPNEKRLTARSETRIIKTYMSTHKRIKRVSPAKVVKKPSVLDFVPQKTHAFRSLPLGAAKKIHASATDTETQINEQSQSGTEESNYNIEDASQAAEICDAVVVSSTASQILGTDCTYFESSQLLRNIEGCCQPTKAQGATEEHRKVLTKPKVNTFDRISLSEGLMARKVWQVNLNWKARQKMSIEVRFSVNKYSLTVCNSSAQLLFNFSPAIWSDILRVLREIDNFEYKRLPMKNYRSATPLHKALRYLFDSAQQIVNVKLTIDGVNPYATCEKANPLYRKPFQCLTKAIAPNILNRMRAMKDSLRDITDE